MSGNTGDNMSLEIYRKRKKITGMIIWGIVGTVVLAALVIFGLFRVQDITVTGNKNFSATTIESEILKDGLCQNTLYFLWKYSDKERAEEALPFLKEIEVKMESPSKVRIKVSEKTAVGYTQALGKYVYFDNNGLVIENSQKLHEEIPLVTGLTIEKVDLYERLKTTDEEKFSNVVLVSDMLFREGMIPDEIRYSTKNELILIFNQLNVMIGDETSMEEKVSVLATILPTVADKNGNLYMENYSSQSRTVTYRDNEESEAEIDAEGNTVSGSLEETPPTQESGGPTYQPSDGTFATDGNGVRYYMDKKGNITYNISQYNYLDENGNIITDGYGYIDPYTGGYIQ